MVPARYGIESLEGSSGEQARGTLRHDEFIGRVQTRSGLATPGAAALAVGATLATLGERVRAEEGSEESGAASGLISEVAPLLPGRLGEALLGGSANATEGETLKERSPAEFSLTEFFGRVGAETGVGLAAAERHAVTFLHLNTHLDHLSALARLQGSKLILARIAELTRREEEGIPVVVTGDFNCDPRSFAHRVFSRAGFADTYLAAGNKDHSGSFTYHAFFEGWRYRVLRCGRRALGGRGSGRLDRILLADPRARLQVRSAVIVRERDKESGIYPSAYLRQVVGYEIR